jgi:hypothetical protein
VACFQSLDHKPNPPRLHGLGDVLEVLRPHIITVNLSLATDLPVGLIGHTDAARFGDAFKASGNVDTIPEDIVVVDDDVPDVDADPKFDPCVLRQSGILLGHAALDLNRTASTALANSTSMPSPVVLTIRPRCLANVGSTRAFLTTFLAGSAWLPHQRP